MVGSHEPASSRAALVVEGSGLRVADTVTIPAAKERLARQAAASAVWIEVDEEFGWVAHDLLASVSRGAAEGRYAAVVSTTAALIDPVAAGIDERRVEIIVDADDRQRAAALAIAHGSIAEPARVSDIAADKNAARLRQLSEEVNRIASTHARLSTGPRAPETPASAAVRAKCQPFPPRRSGR